MKGIVMVEVNVEKKQIASFGKLFTLLYRMTDRG